MKTEQLFQIVHELWCKPSSHKFTEEEKNHIRKYLQGKRKEYSCRYAFYNKVSHKGKYIVFIIDSMRNHRRSGIENNWEYICERPLNDIEFEEEIENWGTKKQRFQVWYYEIIDKLIEADARYDIQTPEKFVAEARKRGYFGAFQTMINFYQ